MLLSLNYFPRGTFVRQKMRMYVSVNITVGVAKPIINKYFFPLFYIQNCLECLTLSLIHMEKINNGR